MLGDCTAPLKGCTGQRLGLVQLYRGTNEGLQRLFVDLVALVEVDGTPGVPPRLELNRPEGSSSEAPLAKVTFTTFLYVSPVQIIPS